MTRQLPMPVQMRDGRSNQACQRRGLTHRARNQAQEAVAQREHPSLREQRHGGCARLVRGRAYGASEVAQCRRAGVAVDEHASGLAGGHVVDPNLTAQLLGVSEEQERTRREGHVQDVHARAAEDFLGHHHGKRHGQGHHPKRHVHWHDERNQHARHEVALVDAVSAHARKQELNPEAHAVADNDERNDFPRPHHHVGDEVGGWPKLKWYWCPMFHMPNNRQGTMATMTKNMVRFRSMPSRMCAPLCVT